jgi:dynein intermediate chain 1
MVGQVAWAPYSSTVFAAVSEGRLVVFDLHVDKYRPICNQKIVTNSVLNCISFNAVEPVVMVGDSVGQAHSLKLSPNLRKKTEDGKKDGEKEAGLTEEEHRRKQRELEVTKLKKVLSQVIQREDSDEEGDY